VDSNGTLVPGTYTEWSATVSSATTFAIVATPVLGSDQVYPAGSTTQVFLPVSSSAHNKLVDGILEFADQSGNLLNQAVKDALGVTTDPVGGWDLLNSGTGPDTVTALGNRSYTLVFNAVDLTSATAVGQRLKLARTVTAPTGSITLNGTTQYANKTSPAGMTFTDDFTVSAWVKVSSYQAGTIASRYNGTSGWIFRMDATGQIALVGTNAGAANYSQITSYQSVPLNKWVHISAQLDMSTYTATTTTSYVMIDGVNVPAVVLRGGTNPTALVQAGNLEIGSQNSGTVFFPGQIAQVAIYSAKVTQATILASMNQTLTGSETSLVSAYKLDQASGLNDLSANANNLTAQGSPSYSTTQTPFTNAVTGTSVTAGTTNYGIIMAQTFSTNTTYTIQIPEGETLPTTGGIGTVSYSTQKTPYGFPGQRGKWNVSTVVSAQLNNVITTTAWANLGSLNLKIPIGSWRFGHEMVIQSNPASAGIADFTLTLGTTAAAAGDAELTSQSQSNTAAVTMAAFGATITRNRFIDLAAETTYYLNARNNTVTNQTIYIRGDTGQCIIYAENAYL